MSLEVLNDDDTVECGYMNLTGRSMPGIGKLPARGSLRGVLFNSQRHLDAAIAFLQEARVKLYGTPTSAKKARTKRKT